MHSNEADLAPCPQRRPAIARIAKEASIKAGVLQNDQGQLIRAREVDGWLAILKRNLCGAERT
jgi:hypothetical protein